MSTSCDGYLVVGVVLNYDKERKRLSPEEFEAKYYGNQQDLDVVLDGMSGEYIVLGKIINRTSEYEDTQFKEVSLPDISKIKKKVEAALKLRGITEVPKLLSFSHWH